MTQSIGTQLTWTALTLLLTGVLLNAIAQLALKASVGRMGIIDLDWPTLLTAAGSLAQSIWLWFGLACYAVSVVVWILALSRVDVSMAYPMLSLGYVVNAFAARWLLDEPLAPERLLGIAIIIVGVWVLARS